MRACVVTNMVTLLPSYVLDGFPVTLRQAELMEARSIIPMVVLELALDSTEVLQRGLLDKSRPNKYTASTASSLHSLQPPLTATV